MAKANRCNPHPQLWRPGTWDEVVGNKDLVEEFQEILRQQLSGVTPLCRLFITGKSRSGKTAVVHLLARCLLCEQLDDATLNPCDGTCASCSQVEYLHGLRGINTYARGGKVHYLPIDCTAISENELGDRLVELRDYEGTRLVYLDEVHRLARRHMDEKLLKPLDDKHFMWIASSAVTGDLEQMFLNRFVMLETNQPTEDELAKWLGMRCVEFGINWDDSETLLYLAEQAGRVPGLALKVLAVAHQRPDHLLTKKLVQGYHFFVDE